MGIGLARSLFLGLVVGGCASAFEGLPARDRARFAQCAPAIVTAACPAGSNDCVTQRRDEYAERSREVDRQMYLVDNGCSRVLAGMPAVGSESGGSASSPRALAALSPRAAEAPREHSATETTANRAHGANGATASDDAR